MILVTFEGIDGSGKSTQAQRLFSRLTEEGYAVEQFREPGGSVLAERIRSILLDPSLSIHALPELLLFTAARAQLVEDRIRPALAEGRIVICDRFYDSTTAYQGAGRQVAEFDWMRALNMRATGGLRPDRTYLMALAPEEARRRTQPRSEADRMERSDDAFYCRVADAYERLAAEESDRIVRLDATRTIDVLAEEIWTDLRRVMDGSEGTAHSG